MKLNLITENIRQKLGIAELNAMQKRMAQAEARSMILLAPTGSGKTLAFTIAMLRLLGNLHHQLARGSYHHGPYTAAGLAEQAQHGDGEGQGLARACGGQENH